MQPTSTPEKPGPTMYPPDAYGLLAYWPLANALDPDLDLRSIVAPYSFQLEPTSDADTFRKSLGPDASSVSPPWAQNENQRAWYSPVGGGLRTPFALEFGRQFFTWECWISWPSRPRGAQTVFEAVTEKGTAWRLGFDDSLRLTLHWEDDAGERAVIRSMQQVDLEPERWRHIAVAFFNECYLGHPYAENYSRAEVYLTPAGALFPRTVALMRGKEVLQVRSGPTSVHFGRRADGSEPLLGVMAGVALTDRAKLKNEFATLGQKPPDTIRVHGDFPQASVFAPVSRGPAAITVGLRPRNGVGNYWFCGGFDVPVGQELDFEIVPVPGGETMVVAIWYSYDQVRWTRIHGGYYDQTSTSGAVFRFRATFDEPKVYLAASVPYTNDMLDRLVLDVAGDPRVETHVPARSVEGRPIPLCCVTDPSVSMNEKKCVYVQAGQHSPGEMVASHTIEAAMRRLLQPSPENVARLKRVAYLFVPIVNRDCAHHGSRAHNENDVNLNRDWLRPTQPETKGLRDFIDQWLAAGRSLDLAIDFHAGGTWVNHVVLAPMRNVMEAVGQERAFSPQESFLDCMDRHMEIKRRDIRYKSRRDRPGSFAGSMLEVHGIPALTIELSHMSYRTLDGKACLPADQAHFKRLGAQLVDALDAYLELDLAGS